MGFLHVLPPVIDSLARQYRSLPECLMATLPHGNSRLQEFSPACSEATISKKNQPLQATYPSPETVLECRPRRRAAHGSPPCQPKEASHEDCPLLSERPLPALGLLHGSGPRRRSRGELRRLALRQGRRPLGRHRGRPVPPEYPGLPRRRHGDPGSARGHGGG